MKTLEDLNKEIKECENAIQSLNVRQHATKILINSVYGYWGNRFSPLGDTDLARSITLTGQAVAKEAAAISERFVRDVYKVDTKMPIVVGGDTDSVVGSSVIRTKDGNSTIEDLWNNTNSVIQLDTTGHEHKIPSNLQVLTYQNGMPIYRKVKRVIRHKVSKGKFRVTVDGKSVITTEDHGLVVIRDDKQCRVSPKDVITGDKFVSVNFTDILISDNFTIERLDDFQDEYVYDFEMDGVDESDHTYFANDILVHNSIYISVAPIMLANKWETSISGKVTPEMYKVCAELEDYLSINITAWAKKTLNTIDPRFVFKRETICDTALFIEKKRYIAHVLDDEGIPTDKYKYIGISVVTTSVPKKLKPFIKKVAETMLQTKSLNETNKVYTKVYEDYKKLNVEDIATTRGVSDYETSANQCDGFKTVKGMPVHVKSAYFYNLMLDQLSLSDKYEKIASGDKIKWYYCMPNRYKTQTMAYKEYLPEDIKVLFPVDTEIMFEKVIGSAVDILYTAAGWPTSTPNNQQSTNLADLFVE